MNRTILFCAALLGVGLSLLLAGYYALPGVYHVLVSGSHPPLDPQPTHVLLFVVLAALGCIMALVNRPGTHQHKQGDQ